MIIRLAARKISLTCLASLLGVGAPVVLVGYSPAAANPISVSAAAGIGQPPQLSQTKLSDSTASRAVARTAAIDTDDRAAVAAAYRDVYLPAIAVSAPEPSADVVTACNPGEPSATLQTATLNLVNYFRQMSQVEPLVFDDVLSAKAQQAALMMYANNGLSHNPPSTWQCFSADGADGAGHSNLGLGYRGADVVRGYMDDDGGNTAVGHRWWLQRPAAQSMGNGTVGSANALWVVGNESAAATPTYTTWPSAGFFPQQLEPRGRWSFVATDRSYDLSAATVAVADGNGDHVASTAYPVGSFGTLVFEVGNLPEPAGSAVDDYRVTVSNIMVDGQAIEPYTYTISMFDPTAPVTPADPALSATSPPTISGQALVGTSLLATAPTWSASGVTTAYQWLRDDEPIEGADSAQLTLTAGDVGGRISVRAVGSKTGFISATADSAQVGPVKVPTQLDLAGSSPSRGRLVLQINLSAQDEPLVDGTVSIKEGSKSVASAVTINDGQGAYTAKNVPPGRHTYAVSYAGTTRLTATTKSIPVTVAAKTQPVIDLKASSPSAEKVKITIGVTALGESPLGGTVTVKEGSTTRAASLKVSKGKATFSASKVKSGPHTYTVRYNGNSHVFAASKTVGVTVKAKVASTMKLIGSSPSANKIKLNIEVRADGQSSLGGTVTIKEGSKTLKSGLKVSKGKASYSASKIKAGSHTYKVSYSGTSAVKGATGTETIKVKAPVKMKSYAKCDDMAKDYPHGVGRTDATDSTSGDPVTNFFRNNKLYSYNDGGSGEHDLDRDNDGIACERH